MDILQLIMPAAGLVIVLIACFGLGWLANSRAGQGKIASADAQAEKIIEEAREEAESLKKTALLEAKDEWYKAKLDFDRNTEEKRNELHKLEMQFVDRERKMDKKVDILNNKEKNLQIREQQLSSRERSIKVKDEQLLQIISEQNQRLEKISRMTQDEAQRILMANLEDKVKREGARRAKEIKDEAISNAEREAREILVMAIQRCAADHSVESTVSIVSLPSDEMKGRIIGREGRNIRVFEIRTGVDVIVDDTPEAVILSSFDPIRREIARISLERLILDGRIHPGRIEEVVEKVEAEIDDKIKEAGEQTAFEVGVHGLHDKLIVLLGKLKYRTSFGQNVLQHSKEVALLAGMMAAELGLDQQLAKRAGLLHDIGKAVDHEVEGTHVEIGSELAKRHREHEVVINAIEAHHEGVPIISPITAIVDAANDISSARPGARRDTLEGYVKRLDHLEELAESFDGVEKTYAIQAGREVRVITDCKLLDDAQADQLASDIADKIESQLEYPDQIKVTVIREIRAVDYAR